MKKKLAIVLSHPIQHFCPLYGNWAKSDLWEICVFFGSMAGAKPYYDPNFKKMVTWEGLGLDQFPHVFLNGEKEVPTDIKIDAPNLEFELEKFMPNAVLTYGYNQKIQRKTKNWAVKNNVAVLFFSDGELRHTRPIWKEWLKQLVVRSYFKKIDWVLVTGNANEEYYRNFGVPASKFLRSSYPIDKNSYEKAFQNRENLRKTTRARLGIAEDELMVIVVGKLVERKRQIDLIQAVGYISSLKVVAVLIGTGELEVEWQEKAAKIPNNRVIFTGFTEAHLLPELYAAADLYTHNSSMEPHSVAVSEAIFMGCPVVISHHCGSYGIDDDVQVGLNGFVYDCGNIEQLANFILKVGNDTSFRQKLSAKSNEIGAKNQRITHEEILNTLYNLIDVS
jgi:glycosyltransferase involved in cell wall biosynthesis